MVGVGMNEMGISEQESYMTMQPHPFFSFASSMGSRIRVVVGFVVGGSMLGASFGEGAREP